MSKELNVKLNDVTADTLALVGSYKGTNEACCSNPFLQVSYVLKSIRAIIYMTAFQVLVFRLISGLRLFTKP